MARLISAYRDRVAGDKLNPAVKVAFFSKAMISFVFDPIILVDSRVHFTTQFYRSVAKVVGIEVSSETVDGEVTWQHFAQYLLKTSPEKDVSKL